MPKRARGPPSIYERRHSYLRARRRRTGSHYMAAIRKEVWRRRYEEKVARQRRIQAARSQQLAWKMKHLGLGSSRPTTLPSQRRRIRSNVPIYKTPRPRYAKNISNNVTNQLKRSMDATQLKIKADRKKFNLRTNYSFQWRPSDSCSTDNPDWFDIYPNRLINNVHLTNTFGTMQLGGKREDQAQYDIFQSIPGKVPTGYREVSHNFESCIVTGTKIQVDIEMPNSGNMEQDQQYIMGMYFEKDGQFTPNQFVRGNWDESSQGAKYAHTASWSHVNAVPGTADWTKAGAWVDSNGIYDRNPDTFTFLDLDRLPRNFREMETTNKPATGTPTELMIYNKTNNPSSQMRRVKRFEFFWNINSTGENVNDLIADTEPREVWKTDTDNTIQPPASSNLKCSGPYGHMFEKDTERNYYAQEQTHYFHEVNMFSNSPGYADSTSVRNGFLEPAKGGIVRFVLFKKSGNDFRRSNMGKLNIQLDFSVLAFNKINYDIDRRVANMPGHIDMCRKVSTIEAKEPVTYDDKRGDQEIEPEDADMLRALDAIHGEH